MTKKHWRTRAPLESFDPRFALLLKKAALRTADKPLHMVFNTAGDCFRFQQRIYQFRGKCREVEHADWKLFQRVTLIRRANELKLYAHDTQFDDMFKAVGVGEDEERPQLAPGEDIMNDPELMALFRPDAGKKEED